MTKKDMGRLTVFKNAYRLRHDGLVKQTAKTENAIYYEIEDFHSGKIHSTIIKLTEHKIINFFCDCTSSSIKSKFYPVCSHSMSALVDAIFTFGRPKRKQI